jgi:hypothetical protein
MRFRYCATIGAILFFATASILLLAPPDQAVAAVCTDPNYANNNATTTYPRFRTGMQESSCPNNAESYIWMSEYWSGSTVNTPTSYIRIFYDISAINSQPYTFDTVSFQTLNNNNHRCGSNVRVQLGGQTQNMYKDPNNFCTIAMPSGLSVNKGMLQQNAAYGPDMRYVDLVMEQLTLDSNAPIRVVSSFWGAKITTRDEYVNGGVEIALWSGTDSSNFITYVANIGTPCDIVQGDTIATTLRWYDADTNAPPQNSNLFIMYLVDDTTGLHVTPAGGLRSDTYNFGGDNVTGKYNVNLVAGHKYRWIWSGIQKNNGIQIKVPFSEVLYDVDCPKDEPDPACAISNIVTFNGDRSTILPGERIKFNATVSGASGYRIGVNGSGYGNEYGGTDIKNYLVSGTAYARGPTFSSDASTSVTVSALGYSDSASVTQAFSAPTAAGSYDFSWGLVRSGIGWKPVTCSGTLRVTDKPDDDPPPPPNISCPSYPPYASFNNPNVVVDLTAKDTDKPADSYSAATGEPSTSEAWTTNKADTYRYREQNQRGTVVYTYYRYITTQSQPKTEVDSVISTISGSSPANVNVDFNDVSDNDGTAELDYTDLAKNYPYDPATPVVTYRVRYEVRERDQYVYRSRTQAQSRKSSKDSWGAYTYPSEGYPKWQTPGTNYGATRAVSFGWTGSLAKDAKQLPPCFPRHYDATPGISGARLDANPENPTSAIVTFKIPTILSFKDGGKLRTATTVTGLDYTVNWYAKGYSNPDLKGETEVKKVNIVNNAGNKLADGITGTAKDATGVLTQSTQSFIVPTDLQAGDKVCFTVTVLQAIGRVKVGGERWLPGNTERTTDEECTGKIVDQPYTRFYGADISAGGGFNTSAGLGSCSAVNTFASAFGPMRSDIFAGSGAQLAVFAIDVIQGIQPLSRSTRTPTQLAFSNTTPTPNIDSRKFGGSFGSKLCAHNYFGDVPENAPWVAANVNLGSLEANDTDRYYRSGNINLTGLLPDGKRAVIYVNGNVTIKDPVGGKVGFATSTYEWGSIDQVPSLYIIASGNINVNNDVTRLDGTFISQGGEIHSCAVNGNYPTISQLTEQCRTQLVVNGAFIANKVNLLRTLGSLRESYSLEVPTSDPTPNDPAPTTPASSRAAEIFIFNPTQWLTNGGGLPSNSKMQIDSYTSLPPSL